MRFILSCLVLSVLCGGVADGQVMVVANGSNYYTARTGSTISSSGGVRLASLLMEPDVREEIELLEYQETELKKLITATGLANKAANDLYLENTRNPKTKEEKQQALQKFQAALEETQQAFEVESQKHLLPRQLIGLKRLAVTRQLEQSGIGNLLSNQSPIGAVLQLSAEEQKQLEAKAAEVRARLKKEIADLKLKAVGEILGELPTDKQNLIRDEFGLEF